MFYQYKVNHKKQVGQRIDKYIALNLREFSRSKIIQLIKSSNITVNNNIVDPDYKDKDLIVINKPAGIVMHPGAGNKTGTIVNALINHCGDELKFVGDAQRPGIVHRIDKDTSGLVVIAKNDFTHKHLSDQFAAHSIERVYIAVCWNKISPANGKIKSLLSRSNRNRTTRSTS